MDTKDENREAPTVPKTSSAMLRDLANPAAYSRWIEFIELYRPVLVYWLNCMKAGSLSSLNSSMYDDIIQETFISLMKIFPKGSFDSEKARFRTFLQTILHNRAVDYLKKSHLINLNFVSNEKFDIFQGYDLLKEPSIDKDDEGNHQLWCDLWNLIIDRVFEEANFSGRAKVIFLRNIAGESLTDLAKEYNIERNALYQQKNRIIKKIKEKAKDLKVGVNDIFSIIDKLKTGD